MRACAAPPSQYELLDALYVLLRQMPCFRAAGASATAGDSANGVAGVSTSAAAARATGREFDNLAEFLHYRAQWLRHCRQLPQQCQQLFEGCAAVNPKTEAGVCRVWGEYLVGV